MAGQGKRNPDYIAHGSMEHAGLLGLMRDEHGKWQLADPTQYLILDPSGKIAEHMLAQKVRELETLFPKIQSDDPRKPGYAPPISVPPGEEDLVRT